MLVPRETKTKEKHRKKNRLFPVSGTPPMLSYYYFPNLQDICVLSRSPYSSTVVIFSLGVAFCRVPVSAVRLDVPSSSQTPRRWAGVIESIYRAAAAAATAI